MTEAADFTHILFRPLQYPDPVGFEVCISNIIPDDRAVVLVDPDREEFITVC